MVRSPILNSILVLFAIKWKAKAVLLTLLDRASSPLSDSVGKKRSSFTLLRGRMKWPFLTDFLRGKFKAFQTKLALSKLDETMSTKTHVRKWIASQSSGYDLLLNYCKHNIVYYLSPKNTSFGPVSKEYPKWKVRRSHLFRSILGNQVTCCEWRGVTLKTVGDRTSNQRFFLMRKVMSPTG